MKKEVSLYDWWLSQDRTEWTHLREIALMVFSLPVSASSCERNWSSHILIQNKLRNRLADMTTQELVSVFTNRKELDKNMRKRSEFEDDDMIDFRDPDEEEVTDDIMQINE